MKPRNNFLLYPYVRPLTISDADSVLDVENAAFDDPRDRATEEKLRYRLTNCPELSLGIFYDSASESSLEPEACAGPGMDTRRKGHVAFLLGHIVSTMTTAPTSIDESMAIPPNWSSEIPSPSRLGHIKEGRTLALHSAAVLPAFQGQGLGRMLMLAYIEQMRQAGMADRIALIAHDHKVDWYTRLGFENKGISRATFGSGGWYDCVLNLKSLDQKANQTK